MIHIDMHVEEFHLSSIVPLAGSSVENKRNRRNRLNGHVNQTNGSSTNKTDVLYSSSGSC